MFQTLFENFGTNLNKNLGYSEKMNSHMLATTGVAEGILSSMQFLVFGALFLAGLICLGIAAMFGGDHDADGDHDMGHVEQATDGQGEHGNAPSFLSPRVFFAFMVGFGAAGTIATIYGYKAGVATAIGFIPGLVMAMIAWGFAVLFYKQQANSNLRPGQVVGASGTVVTPIPVGGMGEVNVSVNGQIIGFTALSEDGQNVLAAGARIRVINDLGGKVVVRKDQTPVSV